MRRTTPAPGSRTRSLRRSAAAVLVAGLLFTVVAAATVGLTGALVVVAAAAALVAALEALAGHCDRRAVHADAADRELRFEADLRHQADHDPLTGLPNRGPLMDLLAEAIRHVNQFATPVALLVLDIDRFKVVNDSLGHDAGDELLVAMATRLASAVRPHDRVARFGADEFIVMCAGVDDDEQAAQIAERLRAEICGRFELDQGDVFVTVSVGVAMATGDEPPEHLLRDADAAMYEAKAHGRDRVQVFDAAVRHRAVDRLDIERALRDALANDEMRLHYQPLVDITTGRIRGVEALVRWEHPSRGLLQPHDFLRVAEETGLIVELGRWILTEAFRLACDCLLDPETSERLPIYVNLSARQLIDGDLLPMVREVIDLTGVDPTVVHFEITEDALMADTASTGSILLALRELGVHLALDDFGTGHSSLAYLKEFPVEALKIDRTFIEGLGVESLGAGAAGSGGPIDWSGGGGRDDGERAPSPPNGDAAITEAIINVAGLLGLSTVAEGVECAEQAEVLVKLGCHVAQGFHFARPMPEADLRALLSPA